MVTLTKDEIFAMKTILTKIGNISLAAPQALIFAKIILALNEYTTQYENMILELVRAYGEIEDDKPRMNDDGSFYIKPEFMPLCAETIKQCGTEIIEIDIPKIDINTLKKLSLTPKEIIPLMPLLI